VAVNFVAWLWGSKYPLESVEKLAAGLRRHYAQKHRLILVTDRDVKSCDRYDVVPLEDKELIGRGCFCRLRTFDPEWQARHELTDRIVGVDLDLVIVDRTDPLFDREEPFVILKGVNAINPNPFNCSIYMLRPGSHSEVWRNFSLDKAQKIQYHDFPDDQGWIWHMLPEAGTWKGGHPSGIYGFKKPGWPPHSSALPLNCRIVAFIGWRKPEQFTHLDWVQKHWRV